MGAEISCCRSTKIDTVQDTFTEKIITDGEKTEFLANILANDSPEKRHETKSFTISTTPVCSPSVNRWEGSKDVKQQNRIFSSNVSGKCVNMIENVQRFHSACSTSFHSKNNSRCTSPRYKLKNEMIE
jgi:hypothetical protein